MQKFYIMDNFKDTFKRVYCYRVARKLLNLCIWILTLLVFVVLFLLLYK